MNANIGWIVRSDDPAVDAGTESPGLTDDPNTDNDTKTVRLRYINRMVFYTMTDTAGVQRSTIKTVGRFMRWATTTEPSHGSRIGNASTSK